MMHRIEKNHIMRFEMKKRSFIFVLGLIFLSFIFSSCVIIGDWNKSYIWIKNNSPHSRDTIESVHIKYGDEKYSVVENHVDIEEGDERMFVVDSGNRVKVGIVTYGNERFYSGYKDLVAGESYFLELDEDGTHFAFCD